MATPDVNENDNFAVEDLLDFPNDEPEATEECAFNLVTADSSPVTVLTESGNSSGGEPRAGGGGTGTHFSDDICVACDEVADLEWLSNFVEESFTNEDLKKLQLISGRNVKLEQPTEPNEGVAVVAATTDPIFSSEKSVPAKARSKRSRPPQGNWNSCLLQLNQSSDEPEGFFVSAPHPTMGKRFLIKKKESGDNSGEHRKCLHCATDKTPQWRTGPMGPKTLCNACGVRYKSGRLVPEYRPAASPTFMLSQHSNSHRKVLEIRRQKEYVEAQHQDPELYMRQDMMFDVSGNYEFMIRQHVDPDFGAHDVIGKDYNLPFDF